jgi:hypothetical protein
LQDPRDFDAGCRQPVRDDVLAGEQKTMVFGHGRTREADLRVVAQQA